MSRVILETFSLSGAERALVVAALEEAGSIEGAAQTLGVTRRAVGRLIAKHGIAWPRPSTPAADAPPRG